MSTINQIKRQARELFSYLWIAVVGTVVNIVSRIFYSEVLGMAFGLSVVVAYGTGMVVGFLLSRAFAFSSRTSDNAYTEAIKYTIVSTAALSVTWAVAMFVKLLADQYFTAHPEVHAQVVGLLTGSRKFINRELLAHITGIGVGFFVNFFGHKFFTFRKTNVVKWVRG